MLPTDKPQITRTQETDLPQLAEVWEASVRATHDFLSEQDIAFFRATVITDYLPSATLYCIREGEEIKAFLGVNGTEIETLFVHPQARGKGYGKQLLEFAGRNFGADRLDVNEQNEQALGFYRHLGFEVESRDETDGYGKPFPILHLKKR